MALYFTLFVAGLLTILLPCILPLIPIVLGVSIAGRSKLRPLLTIAGMLVSFVGFTFLLLVVLNQFVQLADYLRLGTYYVLLLFGLGFLTHNRPVQLAGTAAGALLLISKGWPSVAIGAVLGMIAMLVGGQIASRIQQLGADVQQKAREDLGQDSPLTAFVIGLTLGLVWVPCAGPALGFAFALVREEPGLRAMLALSAYGLGTAIPLLLIGYGGQAAVHSVRAVSKYSGVIKQVSGALLILTAIGLQQRTFEKAQVWLIQNTSFGDLGTRIEERLFEEDMFTTMQKPMPDKNADSDQQTAPSTSQATALPIIGPAPAEFAGLGPWHNSEPLTMEGLRGKVVLVDFWTYSCINCIRTLPYLQQYWEKYQDQSFVLLGVHTPEFVFEKDEQNVAAAIERHGLTYPTAQDNDYLTWRAFENRYWPAKYLIDAEGNIRYTHFGEGAYEETDEAIASLLAEIGESVDTGDTVTEPATGQRRPKTPETYLGARGSSDLGNPSPTAGDVKTYIAPTQLQLHRFYLDGDWELVDREKQVLRSSEGEIRMKFLGSEINLVMDMEEGSPPATVEVLVDGETVRTFDITMADLYRLYDGEYGEHDIILRITGAGAESYAFTFGA